MGNLAKRVDNENKRTLPKQLHIKVSEGGHQEPVTLLKEFQAGFENG